MSPLIQLENNFLKFLAGGDDLKFIVKVIEMNNITNQAAVGPFTSRNKIIETKIKEKSIFYASVYCLKLFRNIS